MKCSHCGEEMPGVPEDVKIIKLGEYNTGVCEVCREVFCGWCGGSTAFAFLWGHNDMVEIDRSHMHNGCAQDVGKSLKVVRRYLQRVFNRGIEP
jgi:hypothetical protein